MKQSNDFIMLLAELVRKYGRQLSRKEKLAELRKSYLMTVEQPPQEPESPPDAVHDVSFYGEEYLNRLLRRLDEHDGCDEQTYIEHRNKLRKKLAKLSDDLDDLEEFMESVNSLIEKFIRETIDQVSNECVGLLYEFLEFAGYKRVNIHEGDRVTKGYFKDSIPCENGPIGTIKQILRYPYELRYSDEDKAEHKLVVRGQCCMYVKGE